MLPVEFIQNSEMISDTLEESKIRRRLMSDSTVEFIPGGARKRVSKACDHCRKRKIKCGPVDPASNKCSNCMKFDTVCTFEHHHEMERQRKAFEMERFAADKKVRKQQHTQPDQSSNVEQKLEKIQQDLSALVKCMSMDGGITIKKLGKAEDKGYFDRTPMAKRKRYTTALLTKRKIAWLKEQATSVLVCKDVDGKNDISDSVGVAQTFIPLKEVLLTSSKWYVVQLKKLIDFSNPHLSSSRELYPIPSENLCKRILETFRTKVFADGFNIVQSEELDVLFRRYHDHERLSYSELLLINVTLLLSTWYDLNDGTFLKKDDLDAKQEEQLQTVEDNTLLNSMYHYHKVSLVCDGIKTIQGLLLLYQHVKAKISGEVSYNIFCIAVRFAQDMGLSRRETYQGLSTSDALQRLIIWYYCVSEDGQLSLSFSKPPLINPDDTDVLTDEYYMEFISEYLLPQVDPEAAEQRSVKTLEQAMTILLNHGEYVLFATSYYSNLLSRISHKIRRNFFSVNALTNKSFDEIVERILKVKQELEMWERGLPPSFSLDTYKQYLTIFEFKSRNGKSVPDIEYLSAHILALHYHHFYLTAVVNLFSCSFFIDNKGAHHLSKYNISDLAQNHTNQVGDMCVRILLLWKNVSVIPNMLHGMLYNFFTGAFVLLLMVIKYCDEVQTAEHIKILCDLYDYLMASGNLRLLTDNIKWNVSMFLYTFLLTLGIKCFNQKNSLASSYQFNSARFESRFGELTQKCESIKNISVAKLKEYMNKYNPTLANDLSHANVVPDGEKCTDNVVRLLNIFNELDFQDLESLASSLPVLWGPSYDDISKKRSPTRASNFAVPSTIEQSNFPRGDDNDSLFPESYRGGFTPQNGPPVITGPLETEILASDPCDFEQLLDNMLFDRDFSLPSNNMQKL